MSERNIVFVGELLDTTELPPTVSSVGVTEAFHKRVASTEAVRTHKLGSDAATEFMAVRTHELGSAVASELIDTFGLDPHSEDIRRVAFAALIAAGVGITDPTLNPPQYMRGVQAHVAFRDTVAMADAAYAEVMEPVV